MKIGIGLPGRAYSFLFSVSICYYYSEYLYADLVLKVSYNRTHPMIVMQDSRFHPTYLSFLLIVGWEEGGGGNYVSIVLP